MSLKKGTPEKQEFFEGKDVKKLYVGLKHSAALTSEGDLYTYGLGNWGVLGQGNEENSGHQDPKLVDWFKDREVRIKDVALGEAHSLALSEDGDLFSWGYGGKAGYFAWMFS